MSRNYEPQKSYVDYKVSVLEDFGMRNSRAIKKKLDAVAEDIADRTKMQHAIDRIARQMVLEYFDGDKTYA